MRIQHNILAMNSYRNYTNNVSALGKNLERLSSGYKINRAGDDAAGLAISEKMRAQITGLEAAQKNVKDGISLVKTAEGAMQEIQDMLNRMDYLATQSANGTYDNEVDRANLQKEVNALRSEINRIADSANFNGIQLLDGSRTVSAKDIKQSAATLTVDQEAADYTEGKVEIKEIKEFASSNFVSDTFHGEKEAKDYQEAEFTIDFAGVEITAVSDANVTVDVTITIGDGFSFTFAVTIDRDSGGVNGESIAEALEANFKIGTVASGSELTIGGVSFDVNHSGTKVTFSVSFGDSATPDDTVYSKEALDAINALKDGAKVTYDVDPTKATDAGATGVGSKGTIAEGLQDVKEAINQQDAELAGINFKLTMDMLKDGATLTIGNTTIKFVEGKVTAGGTAQGSANSYTVSVGDDDNPATMEEIIRQLAYSSIKIGDTNNTGAEFELYLDGDGTLNLHQTSAGQNGGYEEDDIKALFDFTGAPAQAGQKAKIEFTLSDISMDEDIPEVQVGSRVSFGGKTYTIVETAEEAAEDPENKLTVEQYETKLKSDTSAFVSKVADAAKEQFGDDFNVTVDGSKITIEAKKMNKAWSEDDLKKMLGTLNDADKQAKIEVAEITEDALKAGGLTLQIGDTSESYNQMQVVIGNMHVADMGIMQTLVDGGPQTVVGDQSIANIDISTAEKASEAINVIRGAINYVSSVRGDLGAVQNRLEHTQNNLSVMAENIQDAESTIRDTDVAEEMMSYVKNNILVQSAQAMLAQANQVPQGVLQLLG